MYLRSVVVLLAVLPAMSVVLEAVLAPHGLGVMGLIGKWFVFWACGLRLLLAGIRQVVQPRFTAAEIFDLDSVKVFPHGPGDWIWELRDGCARRLHDLPICRRCGRRALLWPRWAGPLGARGAERQQDGGHAVGWVAFIVLLAVVVNGLR
jgi:hypothetical protein